MGCTPLRRSYKLFKMPLAPKCDSIKSYLGLLSYYGRLICQMFLFHYIGCSGSRHHGSGQQQEETIQNSKKLLMSLKLLLHFGLKVILACDPSNYGIRAVLAHRLPDRAEKSIGFASRTLSETEKRYSQLEKEGLACIFGIKNFHSYLFGHPFTLYTDNLPLKSLFCEKRPVPPQAAGQIQRWALILCRPINSNSNADVLSRLPGRTVSLKNQYTN